MNTDPTRPSSEGLKLDRVVLASRNAGKTQEFIELLAPLGIELISQVELDLPSAEETGLTFVENALIKARAVSQASGLPALADDSGLVVPALGGQPGIYSARYAGPGASDADNNHKLLNALEDEEDRRAYFYCALVLLQHADDPAPLIASAAWHGRIVKHPQGDEGFGYDPIFVPAEFSCTSAELDKSEKNRISHRGKATHLLLTQLQR